MNVGGINITKRRADMRKKIAALVAAVNALFVLIVPQTRQYRQNPF